MSTTGDSTLITGIIIGVVSGIIVVALTGAFAWLRTKRKAHNGWYSLLTSKRRERKRKLTEKRKLDERIAHEAPYWNAQMNVIRHAERLREMEMRPVGTYWHGEWRRERSEITEALKEYLKLGTAEPHRGKELKIPNSEGHFIVTLWEARIVRSGKRAFVSVLWSPHPFDSRFWVGDPRRHKIVFRRWLTDDQAEAIGLKLDTRCAATE